MCGGGIIGLTSKIPCLRVLGSKNDKVGVRTIRNRPVNSVCTRIPRIGRGNRCLISSGNLCLGRARLRGINGVGPTNMKNLFGSFSCGGMFLSFDVSFHVKKSIVGRVGRCTATINLAPRSLGCHSARRNKLSCCCPNSGGSDKVPMRMSPSANTNPGKRVVCRSNVVLPNMITSANREGAHVVPTNCCCGAACG